MVINIQLRVIIQLSALGDILIFKRKETRIPELSHSPFPAG
jgi:hypothetical protein